MRRIGAHLSVAGGFSKAVDRAVEKGYNALQIFSNSPRVWSRSAYPPETLQAFAAAAQKQDVWPIFVHALYLTNISGSNPETVEKTMQALQYELEFGEAFGCAGVVVHLGSHQGRGWESVRDEVAERLRKLLRASGGSVPLLIENSAGQKGKLCSDFADIRWLLDQVDSPRLGWCYDTCHGWAAGYGVENGGSRGDIFAAIEANALWDRLQCVHVNGSRDPQSSGRDRHANLGEGELPLSQIVTFLQHPRIAPIPAILEVPGFDGEGPDAQNIELLKQALAE